MKRIVSMMVIFTLLLGGMTHVQAQTSKAAEKAEKKQERKEKKEERLAKDAVMAAPERVARVAAAQFETPLWAKKHSTMPCRLSQTGRSCSKPTPYNR